MRDFKSMAAKDDTILEEFSNKKNLVGEMFSRLKDPGVEENGQVVVPGITSNQFNIKSAELKREHQKYEEIENTYRSMIDKMALLLNRKPNSNKSVSDQKLAYLKRLSSILDAFNWIENNNFGFGDVIVRTRLLKNENVKTSVFAKFSDKNINEDSKEIKSASKLFYTDTI